MTDIHSEIKGLKSNIQKNLEFSGTTSNPNWKDLIAIVKKDQSESDLGARGEYFNTSGTIIDNPLGQPLEYRVCNSCGKPISLSVIVEHLKSHCKGSQATPSKFIKQEDEGLSDEMSKKKTMDSKRPTPFEVDTPPEDSPSIKKQRKGAGPSSAKAKRKIKQRNPTEKHLIDFDKQCGVELPEGGCCGRSLTCKSHSMGAKRAVVGRSQPFDVLLAQYQKKNQLKTGGGTKTRSKQAQSTQSQHQSQQGQSQQTTDGSASLLTPEEETTQVLNGVSRSFPLPLESTVLSSTRSRTKFFRMREMFASSFSVRPGYSAPGYGAIHSRVGCIDLDRTTDYTFRIRTPQPLNQMNQNNLTPQQMQKLQQQRMLQAQMLAQQQQQQKQQTQQQVQQQSQNQQNQPNGFNQPRHYTTLSQSGGENGLTPQDIQRQQQRLRQQQVQQQRFEAAAFHLATATKLMQGGSKTQPGPSMNVPNAVVGSPVNISNSRSNSNTLNTPVERRVDVGSVNGSSRVDDNGIS
ncbi:LAFE_0C04522g1_1 [Lachancea fermentati]|uniref:LAFE_0C04522g1_1 n=1 Tax=Lachancea fermentati TaxID=4955 RepID=A0A1G4M9A6_LACFM|nr:LAFE_0C04522g1_1 [Lachancea fermentati]